MLVLTRKLGEQLVIGPPEKQDEQQATGAVYLTVLGIRGKSVKFGITAPVDVRILRAELPKREVRVPGEAKKKKVG